MSDLIIVGDEAWTPEEYEQMLRSRERRRISRRKWEERNREHRRTYFREYQRRRRAGRRYTHLTLEQIDTKIAEFAERINRLNAEKRRRLGLAA